MYDITINIPGVIPKSQILGLRKVSLKFVLRQESELIEVCYCLEIHFE